MDRAIAFDTHRFVKNLIASGFSEKQAETLASEHVRLLEGNLATKADIATTKADIAAVGADLQARIQKVEADFKVEIQKVNASVATVKADLLKWMVTAMTAQTALIAGLVVGLIQFL